MSSPQVNTRAIDAVAQWIARCVADAQPLAAENLARSVLRDAKAGWLLTLEGHSVQLLLDGAFPYSLPRVALVNPTQEASLWPHIEDDGKLCLVPTGNGVDSQNPVSVAEDTLQSAARLLRENEAGQHREDYQIDFDAYWQRGVARSIKCLLEAAPPSRSISLLVDQRLSLIAEREEVGRGWLLNRFGPDANPQVTESALIWLDRLPDPPDYPATALELRNFVRRNSKDGLAVLDRVITAKNTRIHIVIGGQAKKLSSLGALILRDKPGNVIPGRKTPTSIRGFRPGRAPAQIVALHKTAERLRVVRVDDASSRLPSEYQSLNEEHVVIIGCGSLGSGVARQLAMTGLGRLTLIDPEKLSWANIGRHELGARAVDVNKALALSKALTMSLPQLQGVKAIAKDWQTAYNDDPNLFDTASLIVSAIGSWNPEVALDDMSTAGHLPCPILYGWLENRACAAHALALYEGRPCFRCGFTAIGHPNLEATVWPEQEVDPRCGGGISLYGAIDLGFAVSLVSGLAIELLTAQAEPPVWRTWLAPSRWLSTNGGFWNPEWISARGDPGSGGLLTAGNWAQRQDCQCGQVI